MILIVGATGDLGTAVARRLRDKGLPVGGLVRPASDPAKVNYLKRMGVNVMQGNLKDRVTLDAACQGIDTVITTATITMSRQPDDTIQNVDHAGQISLIDAAEIAGVRHFIYVSYSRNLDTDSPLTTAKRAVETHLMRSGMKYTILRPSFFMEVWLSPIVGFDYPNAKATLYGDGHHKISWISRGDVAAFAVASLYHPKARNAILELGGPEALSPFEVVNLFEREMHTPFEIQHVSEDTLRLQKAQATDSVAQSFSALMLDYAKGDVIDMTELAHTFPVKLMAVTEYVHHLTIALTDLPGVAK